jgi:hypothetical protein
VLEEGRGGRERVWRRRRRSVGGGGRVGHGRSGEGEGGARGDGVGRRHRVGFAVAAVRGASLVAWRGVRGVLLVGGVDEKRRARG